MWFEETYPLQLSKPRCQLNVVGSKDARLHVADEPVRLRNIDVGAFNVYFEVVPAPNQMTTLQVAVGPGKKVALGWGFRL